MNSSPFDRCPPRGSTDSVKWTLYGPDVLPLWVADMDVQAPPAVLSALAERVQHGVFGYGREPKDLAEVLVERLDRLYRWKVSAEDVVFVPGVMPGANVTTRVMTQPRDGILLPTPLYPPLRRMPGELDRVRIEVDFQSTRDGQSAIDWDRLRHMAAAESTKLLVLCNPHNPTGRVLSRGELTQLAEICLEHDLGICSDEIHCDLVHQGHEHVPIASLGPDVANRSVTLMAPSKTFNLAGLGCAFAIIENQELRSRWRRARGSLIPHVDVLGFVAATAAYRHEDAWLKKVLEQLSHNRSLLSDYLGQHLPGIHCYPPEGTYLAWLDCSQLGLPKRPFEFFLDEARVALNDGGLFGSGYSQWVRLNFACAEATLREALDRMRSALDRKCGVR